MKRLTRREFGQSLGLPLIRSTSMLPLLKLMWTPNSVINGVQIGIQGYSFRDRSFDSMVAAVAGVGINSCELWSGHVEPSGLDKESRTRWRLETPLSQIEKLGSRLSDAGIELNAFYYDFRKTMDDSEIERGF